MLKDGILQQVDTPQTLYDHPGNVFVAGFIGSPSMNFFDATLVEEGDTGRLMVDGGSFRLAVPANKTDAVRKYRGQQVIFGIRPEDLHNAQYTPPGFTAAPMQAKVDVTELMGNEIFVYLLTGEKQFMARVDPRTRVRAGDALDLNINMDYMHLFDPKTEAAII